MSSVGQDEYESSKLCEADVGEEECVTRENQRPNTVSLLEPEGLEEGRSSVIGSARQSSTLSRRSLDENLMEEEPMMTVNLNADLLSFKNDEDNGVFDELLLHKEVLPASNIHDSSVLDDDVNTSRIIVMEVATVMEPLVIRGATHLEAVDNSDYIAYVNATQQPLPSFTMRTKSVELTNTNQSKIQGQFPLKSANTTLTSTNTTSDGHLDDPEHLQTNASANRSPSPSVAVTPIPPLQEKQLVVVPINTSLTRGEESLLSKSPVLKKPPLIASDSLTSEVLRTQFAGKSPLANTAVPNNSSGTRMLTPKLNPERLSRRYSVENINTVELEKAMINEQSNSPKQRMQGDNTPSTMPMPYVHVLQPPSLILEMTQEEEEDGEKAQTESFHAEYSYSHSNQSDDHYASNTEDSMAISPQNDKSPMLNEGVLRAKQRVRKNKEQERLEKIQEKVTTPTQRERSQDRLSGSRPRLRRGSTLDASSELASPRGTYTRKTSVAPMVETEAMTPKNSFGRKSSVSASMYSPRKESTRDSTAMKVHPGIFVQSMDVALWPVDVNAGGSVYEHIRQVLKYHKLEDVAILTVLNKCHGSIVPVFNNVQFDPKEHVENGKVVQDKKLTTFDLATITQSNYIYRYPREVSIRDTMQMLVNVCYNHKYQQTLTSADLEVLANLMACRNVARDQQVVPSAWFQHATPLKVDCIGIVLKGRITVKVSPNLEYVQQEGDIIGEGLVVQKHADSKLSTNGLVYCDINAWQYMSGYSESSTVCFMSQFDLQGLSAWPEVQARLNQVFARALAERAGYLTQLIDQNTHEIKMSDQNDIDTTPVFTAPVCVVVEGVKVPKYVLSIDKEEKYKQDGISIHDTTYKVSLDMDFLSASAPNMDKDQVLQVIKDNKNRLNRLACVRQESFVITDLTDVLGSFTPICPVSSVPLTSDVIATHKIHGAMVCGCEDPAACDPNTCSTQDLGPLKRAIYKNVPSDLPTASIVVRLYCQSNATSLNNNDNNKVDVCATTDLLGSTGSLVSHPKVKKPGVDQMDKNTLLDLARTGGIGIAPKLQTDIFALKEELADLQEKSTNQTTQQQNQVNKLDEKLVNMTVKNVELTKELQKYQTDNNSSSRTIEMLRMDMRSSQIEHEEKVRVMIAEHTRQLETLQLDYKVKSLNYEKVIFDWEDTCVNLRESVKEQDAKTRESREKELEAQQLYLEGCTSLQDMQLTLRTMQNQVNRAIEERDTAVGMRDGLLSESVSAQRRARKSERKFELLGKEHIEKRELLTRTRRALMIFTGSFFVKFFRIRKQLLAIYTGLMNLLKRVDTTIAAFAVRDITGIRARDMLEFDASMGAFYAHVAIMPSDQVDVIGKPKDSNGNFLNLTRTPHVETGVKGKIFNVDHADAAKVMTPNTVSHANLRKLHGVEDFPTKEHKWYQENANVLFSQAASFVSSQYGVHINAGGSVARKPSFTSHHATHKKFVLFDWELLDKNNTDEQLDRIQIADVVLQDICNRTAGAREREYVLQMDEFVKETRVLARIHLLHALMAHVDLRIVLMESVLAHWHRLSQSVTQHAMSGVSTNQDHNIVSLSQKLLEGQQSLHDSGNNTNTNNPMSNSNSAKLLFDEKAGNHSPGPNSNSNSNNTNHTLQGTFAPAQASMTSNTTRAINPSTSRSVLSLFNEKSLTVSHPYPLTSANPDTSHTHGYRLKPKPQAPSALSEVSKSAMEMHKFVNDTQPLPTYYQGVAEPERPVQQAWADTVQQPSVQKTMTSRAFIDTQTKQNGMEQDPHPRRAILTRASTRRA